MTSLAFIPGRQKKTNKLGTAAVSPNVLIVHHLIQFCDDTESVPIGCVRKIFIHNENSPPICQLFILNIIDKVFFLFFNWTIAINFSLLVMHSREGTCQQ